MRTRQGRPVRSKGMALAALSYVLGLLLAAPVLARDPDPFPARGGLDVARAAASSWAPDAELIYVENDEAVAADGTSERWGYLFHSKTLGQVRAYSIRGGKIVVAETLDMKFEAPPLSTDWIDSGAAIEAGDRIAASEFKKTGGASLTTMLLMRGAFQDKDPDQTTWTLIYTSPRAPSLFVVVDASAAKVRRTWRG
ncbi:MAG TPA: hypothetical protein VFQ05_16040 [Candidatus Eisenbacteria bacterium]|nr:hypothetical protein [Candidatus Eisenbacteria bacterium]